MIFPLVLLSSKVLRCFTRFEQGHVLLYSTGVPQRSLLRRQWFSVGLVMGFRLKRSPPHFFLMLPQGKPAPRMADIFLKIFRGLH